jgi:hypothetical protein
MTNLKNKLNPLQQGTPIVDANGRPTPEFMVKWAQQGSSNGSIPDMSTIHVLAGTGLTGGGALTDDVTLSISATGVVVGTYGDPLHVAKIVVSAEGQITSASSVAIQTATVSQLGLVQPDGTSITITAGGVISAANGSTPGNPTATASDTAVNGTAATYMRSDAAPAVQLCSNTQFGLCKVDGTTVTEAGGVISASGGSGGSGNTYAMPMASAFTTSGQAYATQGNWFMPVVGFTIDEAFVSFFGGMTSGHVYVVTVFVVNGSLAIQSVLGSATVTATASGTGTLIFSFGSKLGLAAGTEYVIALTDTSVASGTTGNSMGGNSASFVVAQTYPNLPMNAALQGTRVALASNSGTITSGTFTNIGGVAAIGMRAQGL